MDVYHIVLSTLRAKVEHYTSLPFPTQVQDTLRLEDLWLDSLAYTSLLDDLEAQLGIIPTKLLQGTWYPETLGELVAAYTDALSAAN